MPPRAAAGPHPKLAIVTGASAGSGKRSSRAPGVLTAEQAALELLEQVRGRDVVRVPTLVYKVTAAVPRLLPRVLLRRVSARVHRPMEET